MASVLGRNIVTSSLSTTSSTVMALNERSFTRRNRFCNTGAGRRASVKTNPSIVAMSGAIMPEPLAKPEMVTVALPIFTVRDAPLAKVSVVMMASAAWRQPRARKPRLIPASLPAMKSGGTSSPMTPVEAT